MTAAAGTLPRVRCRGYSGFKSKRVILDNLNLNKLCILFINDKCRNRKY